MDLPVLHRGLLYALVAKLPSGFLVDHHHFHDAYEEAMNVARDCPSETCENANAAALAAEEALTSYDGAFGMFQTAEQMIVEGMRDLILFLEPPKHERLRWKIGFGAAEHELLELCSDHKLDVGLFRAMANAFAEVVRS